MLFLAALPDLGWLIVVAIVIAIIVLIGLAKILSFLREFRSNMAAELKRDIGEKPEPSQVNIQSPLIITEQTAYATVQQHERLKTELDVRLTALAKSGSESRDRMHKEIGYLQVSVGSLKTETDKQTRDLSDLKLQIGETATRIDEIPARTIRLLNDTKQLHRE